jgi:DNA-binding SARP family transcriptional activator
LRLRTFGGLWIEPESDRPLAPRPLALLALVASAGPKGISRDRVIGILWAETGEEQARHSLSQTIYSLHRTFGRDLIVGTSQLKLDSSLGSDVAELRNALAAGDLEAAATVYVGPFLEGFYLPGASEFERWVEQERRGLDLEAKRVLERLARQADDAGHPAESVRHWQRLAELDPLSARYAAGLVRALGRSGDRSGALARVRAHREIVARELDAEPDAEILRLESSLRMQKVEPAPVAPPAAPPPTTNEPPSPRAPARRPVGIVRWLLPALVALPIVVLALRREAGGPANPPFLAVGQIRTESPDSTRLGPILRDMLATSLGAIEGLQVVANSRLVELLPRDPNPAAESLNDAARRAGAREIIEGELGSGPDGLVLSFRRVRLDRGVVSRGYFVRARDRYGIVDSAAAAIARDLGLGAPPITVAQIRTSSPVAYALYEEGLRAFYGYDAPAALRLMDAALARDSNFAMAAWYAWQVRWSLSWGDTTTYRAMERVERLAGRTIERERLLIQASVAGIAEPMGRALAIAETLAVKYPDDPDGQYQLGVARESAGEWAGAVIAYERAFTLDSMAGALTGPYCRACKALHNLGRVYLWWDSVGAAERTASRGRAAAQARDGVPPTGARVEALGRQGRRTEAEADAGPGAWSSDLMRDLLRWGRYPEADRAFRLAAGNPSSDIRSDAKWLLLLSLRDQGRLQEAYRVIQNWNRDSLSSVANPSPPPVDLAFLAVEMGRPDLTIRVHRSEAQQFARALLPEAWKSRGIAWNLTLAGTAHAVAGDTAVVRRLADSVERIGRNSYWGRDIRLHHVLRGLLLQAEGNHAAGVEEFRRSLFSLTDGYTRSNLMLARSLLALGQGKEAVSILQSAIRGGVDGSNTYVSRTELHEALAEAFEQAGLQDSARAHWRAVESAWRRADPQFQQRYLRAKAREGTRPG